MQSGMANGRSEQASVPAEHVTFSSLGLAASLVDALGRHGYERPTPIQREAIPSLLRGRDLVGQAATGTGKTAAFALPVLHRLAEAPVDRPRPSALILVPTRELAVQVAEAVQRYGEPVRASVLAIYGGQSFVPQLRALKRGVDVVVATPGRALDHIRRGTLELESVGAVILDEADEMLDMGFADDLEAILAETPATRQTVLFSATMPPRIAAIARRHLVDPVHVVIPRERVAEGEAPRVRQAAYIVARAHKPAALARVLDMEGPEAAIVFCRTRNDVDELTERMSAHGYRAEALHGGMSQEQRDRVMNRLRSGAADLVAATDVAARGLDIARLTHVVNYDVPTAPEAYVHRIGRVGRAGREGVALTLAEPRERRQLRNIERLTKRSVQIEKVPTIADLRARRLEATRATLREALLEGGHDGFDDIVESLAGEFDLAEVAAAAVALLHRAAGEEPAGEEIPEVARRDAATARKGKGERGGHASRHAGRGPSNGRNGASHRGRGAGSADVSRLFVGLGRSAGVRPKDLVGAITGEAGITGQEIGAIDIADRFSIVEVAENVAGDVVAALRESRIKGRKVVVRRDREG